VFEVVIILFGHNIFKLQAPLGSIADWMTSNLPCLNSTKTEKFFLLGVQSLINKIETPALTVNNGTFFLPASSARNLLGFIFS